MSIFFALLAPAYHLALLHAPGKNFVIAEMQWSRQGRQQLGRLDNLFKGGA